MKRALFGLILSFGIGSCGDDDGGGSNGPSGSGDGTSGTTGSTTSASGGSDGSGGVTDTSDTSDDGESGSGTGAGDCGNGQLDPGEDCDDGNDRNGDGCNNDCVPSGMLLWSHVIPGDRGASDIAFDVAADGLDRLAAVGYVDFDFPDNTDANIWIGVFDPDGAQAWTTVRDDMTGLDDRGRAIAGGTTGEIVAAGWLDLQTPWAALYDIDGNPQWEVADDELDPLGAPARFDPGGVAASEDGSIVFVSSVLRDSQVDVWAQKRDFTGAVIWTQTHDTGNGAADGGNAVALGPGGGIAIAGITRDADQTTNTDVLLMKLDADGVHQWSRTYAGAAGELDTGNGVAIDPDGNVFVLGEVIETNADPGDHDAWIAKYSPDGDELWTRHHDGGSDVWVRARDIATDSVGDLILAGSDDRGPDQSGWIRKHDGDGNELWVYEEIDVSPWGVAADSTDAIVAAGLAVVDGDNDLWVGKLTP